MERVSEQIVAEQNGRFVTPFDVDRCGMASYHGLVENVVMHQTGRVDHFDDGGKLMMNGPDSAASPGRQQQENRPETLPLKACGVIDKLLNERHGTFQLGTVDFLAGFEILGDRQIQSGKATPGMFDARKFIRDRGHFDTLRLFDTTRPAQDHSVADSIRLIEEPAGIRPIGHPISTRAESPRSSFLDQALCTYRIS